MDIKTIVAAVDLDDDLCDAVLQAGLSMAERLGAALHVIDAWPPMPNMGFPYAQGAIAPAIETHTVARERRRRELEAKVAALEPRAVTMVPVGDAPGAITAYAEDVEADLLVIGSHQKGLFQRLLGGETSVDIIHAAPCGVLLVTPGLARKQFGG